VALSDYWQIKDNQVYNGKPVLNIYHAKRIDGGANADTVAQAFRDTILDGVLDVIQPVGLTRTTIEVENLDTVTDFAVLNSSGFPGVIVGQNLPSFNGASIQFNRTRTDMKNGMKRFLAGTESEQDDGEWVAGFVTLMDDVGDALVSDWEFDANPGVPWVNFVILKRWCVIPEQDPCQVYRLPENSAEVDANHYVPLTFISRSRVRSQVSRKVLQ
jgi:hypothetical protein